MQVLAQHAANELNIALQEMQAEAKANTVEDRMLDAVTQGMQAGEEQAFNDTYGRVYAASARSPELGYSVTGAIMRGSVPTTKPRIPKEALGSETPDDGAFLGTRRFYRKQRWVDAQLYLMEALNPGNRIAGPAVIESDATTFIVPEGFETFLDEHRLFHLTQT